jgi:hypothetical protein
VRAAGCKRLCHSFQPGFELGDNLDLSLDIFIELVEFFCGNPLFAMHRRPDSSNPISTQKLALNTTAQHVSAISGIRIFRVPVSCDLNPYCSFKTG